MFAGTETNRDERRRQTSRSTNFYSRRVFRRSAPTVVVRRRSDVRSSSFERSTIVGRVPIVSDDCKLSVRRTSVLGRRTLAIGRAKTEDRPNSRT